jgi:hypothetical protein
LDPISPSSGFALQGQSEKTGRLSILTGTFTSL